MITEAHTQIIMGVLSAAAHMATKRTEVETGRHQLQATAARLEHERGLFETKAAVMKKLIRALVEKRVAAVKNGFSEVLGMYAEQARHYMAQQEKYNDAELAATDPLQRAELRKRVNDVDIELRRIRGDARRIYTQMTEIVLLLGGSALKLDADYDVSLGFGGAKALRHG